MLFNTFQTSSAVAIVLAAAASASPLNVGPQINSTDVGDIRNDTRYLIESRQAQNGLPAACALKAGTPYQSAGIYMPGNLMPSAQVRDSIHPLRSEC
jgi:hypothetical protein